jgi:ABC-type methionine transport system permease subunit
MSSCSVPSNVLNVYWSLSQGSVIVVLLRESMPNIVQTQGVLILWIVHLNAMISTQLNHYRFFD